MQVRLINIRGWSWIEIKNGLIDLGYFLCTYNPFQSMFCF